MMFAWRVLKIIATFKESAITSWLMICQQQPKGLPKGHVVKCITNVNLTVSFLYIQKRPACFKKELFTLEKSMSDMIINSSQRNEKALSCEDLGAIPIDFDDDNEHTQDIALVSDPYLPCQCNAANNPGCVGLLCVFQANCSYCCQTMSCLFKSTILL